MKTNTIETLVWVLIYGGLLAVGLGLSVQREASALGVCLAIGGGVVAAAGAALIYLRSRMKSSPSQHETPP